MMFLWFAGSVCVIALASQFGVPAALLAMLACVLLLAVKV